MRVEPVILVGGKGVRLGESKISLSVNGVSILHRICWVLGDVFERAPLLVGGAVPHLPYKSIPDKVRGVGPIGGLFTALGYTDADTVFLTGCDMPFINGKLIRFMWTSFKMDFDIYIPVHGDELIEPLFAFYRKRIYSSVKRQIDSGDYRLRTLLESCNVQFLPEKEVRTIDPRLLSFFNINTKKELEFAERLLKSEAG